jgi:hypothetical protein
MRSTPNEKGINGKPIAQPAERSEVKTEVNNTVVKALVL